MLAGAAARHDAPIVLPVGPHASDPSSRIHCARDSPFFAATTSQPAPGAYAADSASHASTAKSYMSANGFASSAQLRMATTLIVGTKATYATPPAGWATIVMARGGGEIPPAGCSFA